MTANTAKNSADSAAVGSSAVNLRISASASRPSALPFFTVGRNNLNPQLTLWDGGITIRVVRRTSLAWGDILHVDVRRGYKTTYAVITNGRWDYIAYFNDRDALLHLLARLQDADVNLTPAATEFVNACSQPS